MNTWSVVFAFFVVKDHIIFIFCIPVVFGVFWNVLSWLFVNNSIYTFFLHLYWVNDIWLDYFQIYLNIRRNALIDFRNRLCISYFDFTKLHTWWIHRRTYNWINLIYFRLYKFNVRLMIWHFTFSMKSTREFVLGWFIVSIFDMFYKFILTKLITFGTCWFKNGGILFILVLNLVMVMINLFLILIKIGYI